MCLRITEISVILENRPGRLARMAMDFEREKINMRGISVAESGHFSIVRFVCDHPQKAIELLKSQGFSVCEKKVLGVRIKDDPGVLAKVAKILGDEAINIEYAYGTLIHLNDETVMVLQVDAGAKAAETLGKHGIELISDSDFSTAHG